MRETDELLPTTAARIVDPPKARPRALALTLAVALCAASAIAGVAKRVLHALSAVSCYQSTNVALSRSTTRRAHGGPSNRCSKLLLGEGQRPVGKRARGRADDVLLVER